jgi:nucleolar pre-ribosomal-associated protein 2
MMDDSGGTSLERLKGLDGLADLETQLHHAQALCNHGARAEMILRWLLSKLHKSATARLTAECWDLMSSCARLIPPPRLAVLLASGTFPALFHTTCAALDSHPETAFALRRLWSLLHALGQRRDGASVQALLCVGGATAAAIYAHWSRHLLRLVRAGTLPTGAVVEQRLLDPMVQVWKQRRRAPAAADDDDDIFGAECLLQTAQLLVVFRDGEGAGSKKRKADRNDAPSQADYVRTLEAFVATHAVLPARVAFFRQLGGRAQRGGSVPAAGLFEVFHNMLRSSSSSGQSPLLFDVFPLVLDIGLRAVSATTPQLRFKERPWVEHFFAALCRCLEEEERGLANRVIAEMLQVVRLRNASLPPHTLSATAKLNALPTAGSEQDVDWNLLAEIAKLDANVFVDDGLADSVFSAISSQDRLHEDGSSDMTTLWKDCLVAPIIKAYVQNRRLQDFMEHWHKQLLRQGLDQERSIWDDLVHNFAEDSETTLGSGRVMELFDTYAASTMNAVASASALGDDVGVNQIRADWILLRAIVLGITSDEMADQMKEKLQLLSFALFRLKGIGVKTTSPRLYVAMWELMASMFDVWYPMWAIEKRGSEQIDDLVATVAQSEATKTALDHCDSQTSATASAHLLIGTLCFRLLNYVQGRRLDWVERLARVPDSSVAIFLRWPELLQVLTDDQCGHVLDSALVARSDDNMLSAVVDGLALRARHSTLMANMLASKNPSEAFRSKLSSGSRKSTLAFFLTGLDMASIRSPEGDVILDALLPLPSDITTADLKGLLISILKLLGSASEHAKLFADPDSLESLVRSVEEFEPKGKKKHKFDGWHQCLELLREISDLVMAKWSLKKDRDAHQTKSKQVRKKLNRLFDAAAEREPALGVHYATVQEYKEMHKSMDTEDAVAAAKELIDPDLSPSLDFVRKLPQAIKSLKSDTFAPDDPLSPYDIYHSLLNLAANGPTIHVRRAALQTATLALKEKPFMINQHGVELTLSTLRSLLSSPDHPTAAIHTEICHVSLALITQHRRRLQGRFHLIVGLLQDHITALFRWCPADATADPPAHLVAKLLEFFTHPPHVRSRGAGTALVDASREAQARAGQYVPYVLHHYCAELLVYAPADAVRRALRPGVWAALAAVESGRADGVKALSAAMNHNERAILRSVYDDWKRTAKWEGL